MTFEEWWLKRNHYHIPDHLGEQSDYEFMQEVWDAALQSNKAQIKLGGQKPDTHSEDVYWYKCTACNMQNVPGPHFAKYCPDCGAKIEWLES